ncbi:MAG: hypothetical protein JOZ42_11485 [Acetobacteraceae bacterium]|nr:hypothetical protein [Acetobacteraceae bacterium]
MASENWFSLTEQQKTLLHGFAAWMPSDGPEMLLGYYADLLVGLDAGVSEWINRRREAALAAQTLLAQAREARDLNTLLHAQQDWMLGAWRRCAADAAMFHSAMIFANHVNEVTEQKIRQHQEGGASAARAEPEREPAAGGTPPYIRLQSSRAP